MSKILIVASLDSSLLRFRGDLINEWLNLGHEVVAAAPDGDLKNELSDLGVKYIKIPLKRTGLNPFKDLKLIFCLAHLIYKEKPTFIFPYTIKPVIYSSLAAYILPKCKVFSLISGLGLIFTEHAAKKIAVKWIVINLYRAALKRNSKIFFQNNDDVRIFLQHRIVIEDKVVIINGSGVNITFYNYEYPLVSPPVFLLIARLLREKGICEFIESAEILKAKYPEAVFRLIGWALTGDVTPITTSLIERWKEDGIVDIIGVQKDVRPFLKKTSVYVLPSYREGTPRTVLEAMAMGRAIITTDVPGCRETVVEGVNGFLVPVKDSIALAEAMERFIIEPELIVKMGRESRKIAEEKYDVHRVNEVINQAMGIV